MKRRVLFLLVYFLSPLLPMVAIYQSNPDRYSDLSILTPMVLGCLAYTWLTAEFILSARPKFIEKYFGLDKFYRWHGFMALVSVLLVIFHKMIEEMVMGEFLTSKVGDFAFIIFLGITVLAIFFMTDSYLQKIKPLLALKKYFEKFSVAGYNFQRLLHNFSILGLVVMYIHVMLTSSARMSATVGAVYTVYFAIGVASYFYHKVLKRYWLSKQFIINEVLSEGKPESTKMWTLRMIPREGKIFSYKPGQFGFLRVFGPGLKPEEHPFSISSAPANQEYLAITIKELGDYTATIKNIKPGFTALVDAPYGKFSYHNFPEEESTVFLAGGVGITPALSMLRQMCAEQRHRKILLFWGINTSAELVFEKELEKMQKEMTHFVFIPVVLNDKTWTGEKGFIDQSKIEAALTKNDFQPEKCGFYICGPSSMMKAMIRILRAMGISKNKIHYESFSL